MPKKEYLNDDSIKQRSLCLALIRQVMSGNKPNVGYLKHYNNLAFPIKERKGFLYEVYPQDKWKISTKIAENIPDMTEKQLERGQAITQEIKYLGEVLHRWENLTGISRITITYQYTHNSMQEFDERKVLDYIDISKFQEEVLSNLKNRLKELQDEFNNL